MDLDLKAPLIAAGGAAAFSALVGIFAGVPLGTMLLRALVGGLFFGGLAFGGLLVLRSLAPELFAGAGLEEEGVTAPSGLPEMGRTVDIVLGGEVEEGEADEDLSFPPDSIAPAGFGVVPGEDRPSEGMVPEGETRSGSAPRERLPGNEARPGAASTPVAGAVAEQVEDFDEVEQVAESLSEEIEEPGRKDKGGKGSAVAMPPAGTSLDDLDSLPDLESMSDSFVEELPGEGQRVEAQPERNAASGRGRGGANDPAALAQAVRTLIKRDKKG